MDGLEQGMALIRQGLALLEQSNTLGPKVSSAALARVETTERLAYLHRQEKSGSGGAECKHRHRDHCFWGAESEPSPRLAVQTDQAYRRRFRRGR